jgi:hypothetical protein
MVSILKVVRKWLSQSEFLTPQPFQSAGLWRPRAAVAIDKRQTEADGNINGSIQLQHQQLLQHQQQRRRRGPFSCTPRGKL